jgi:hypothetical protein
MDTRTRRTALHNYLLSGLLLTMAACGGGSTGGPDCRYNAAWENGQCSVSFDFPDLTIPDGIWRGVDSAGRPVVAYVDRFSLFHFVDGLGNQGAGFLSVGSGEVITSSFQLVTERGTPFSDGTTSAACTFAGMIVERVSLTVSQDCVTTSGLRLRQSLNLAFDPLYSRESSLAIVSGLYATPSGSVLEIAADGTTFMQDAASGCVANGQIRITVSFTNMYRYAYEISNCTGPEVIWNGASFSGLAILDDTFAPEILTFAAIGEVQGVPVSLVVDNDRL